MPLVVQGEHEAISRRTMEALSVAKARGVKLGNPNGAAALRRAGTDAVALSVAVVANAHQHAADLTKVVADIRTGGATSLRAMEAVLNAPGMLTRRWAVAGVQCAEFVATAELTAKASGRRQKKSNGLLAVRKKLSQAG